MKGLKIFTVLAVAVLILSSCCSTCYRQNQKYARPLAKTDWKLIQYGPRAVDSENGYQIVFSEDGRVSGVGQCNRMTAPYKITKANKNGVEIGPIASTMMACLGDDSIGENAFFRTLESADSYKIELNNLYLFRNGELVAVFEATDKPAK